MEMFIACLLCKEIKQIKAKKHEPTPFCTPKRHYDFCASCQKKFAAIFDKALAPFVYIRTEQDESA